MRDNLAEDAITLLMAEHATLRGLLEETARSAAATPLDEGRLAECAGRLQARLATHERREREVLYPALSDMAPVRFADSEHSRLDGVMDALDRALAAVRDTASAASGATLRRAVEEMAYCLAGHILNEEQVVFGMARAMIGPERLREMGAQMADIG